MPDCGKIDIPNGRVDPANDTSYPVNLTYFCDPGYDLVGDKTRACQSNRSWTGSNSTCKPKGWYKDKRHSYVIFLIAVTY